MSVGEDARLQLALWGYAITGDVTNGQALLCEARRGDDWFDPPWDRRRADLANSVIVVGHRPRRPPDWFCLRWLPMSLREEALAALHSGDRSTL